LRLSVSSDRLEPLPDFGDYGRRLTAPRDLLEETATLLELILYPDPSNPDADIKPSDLIADLNTRKLSLFEVLPTLDLTSEIIGFDVTLNPAEFKEVPRTILTNTSIELEVTLTYSGTIVCAQLTSPLTPTSYQIANGLDAENNSVIKSYETVYKKNEPAKTFSFRGLNSNAEYSIACTGWNTYPGIPTLMADEKIYHSKLTTQESDIIFEEEFGAMLAVMFAVLLFS
jgi:hypothetical protein